MVALAVEIFAVVGTLAFPYLGFLFFVFWTILRPQDDRPNVQELHYPMVLLFAVLASTVPRMSTDPSFSLARTVGKVSLIVIYFILMVVSAVATGYTPNSAFRVHEFFVVVLTCIMFLFWGSTEKKLWGIMGCMGAAGLQLSRDALTRTHWHQETIGAETFSRMDMNRLNGNFGSPNYIALLMAVLMLIALSFLYTNYSKWLKLGAAGSIGLFFWIFLRAESRGATLGIVAALVAFFIFQRRKIVSGALLVVVFAGALAFAPKTYFDRLHTIVNYEADSSATSRLELWNIGLRLIKEHPIFGVGPDNFMAYAFNGPHDCYIQAAAEMGLPAAFLYCAILISGLISSIRAMQLCSRLPDGGNLRTLTVACVCIITHMIIQGFTTGFAHREFVYFFIAISHCTFLVASEMTRNADLKRPAPVMAPRRVRVVPAT
jgi:O-antigen ligase